MALIVANTTESVAYNLKCFASIPRWNPAIPDVTGIQYKCCSVRMDTNMIIKRQTPMERPMVQLISQSSFNGKWWKMLDMFRADGLQSFWRSKKHETQRGQSFQVAWTIHSWRERIGRGGERISTVVAVEAEKNKVNSRMFSDWYQSMLDTNLVSCTGDDKLTMKPKKPCLIPMNIEHWVNMVKLTGDPFSSDTVHSECC